MAAALFLSVTSVRAGDVATTRDGLGDPLPRFALARLGTERLRHQYHAMSIAFAPDGKTLATVAGDVRLWDVASGKELRRFENPGDMLKSIDFAADGQSLIGAGYFTQAYYFFNAERASWHTASAGRRGAGRLSPLATGTKCAPSHSVRTGRSLQSRFLKDA